MPNTDPSAQTQEQDWREHVWHAQDDVALYVRSYGSRDADRIAVVCLPGLTRNADDFAALAPALATRGHFVVCPDVRGRGRSAFARDWRSYRAPTLVGDLVGLLAVFNLHRVAVIGTSLGGLLAMGLAVAQPASLAAVVLNDVGPTLSTAGIDRIRTYVADDRPVLDWPSAIRQVQTRFPKLGLKSDAEWEAFARATFREGPDGRLWITWDPRIARAVDRPGHGATTLWRLYAALRHIPTLAIRGENSDVLSQETFDEMLHAKPDLERVLVPERGHAPTLGEDAVMARLPTFLAHVAA